MEDTLQLILQELRDLKSGQARLDARMDGIEGELTMVKSELTGVKTELDSVQQELTGVKTELDSVQQELTGVKTELQKVKGIAEATFEQVGVLSEFRAETNEQLNRLREEFNEQAKVVERLTFRSIAQEADIAALKRERLPAAL